MPRLPRVHVEGALYYVTSQGMQNLNLFNDEGDYLEYLELLKKYKNEHGFKLFAYVLFPKQLHLLIEPKSDATISTIMHSLNSTYTKIFNNRYQKKGHVFQGRFRAVIIEKEDYLLRLTRHIHVCPVKLGMTSDPKEYPYCSYTFYLMMPTETFLAHEKKWPELQEEIKEVFSHLKENGDPRQSYEDFVSASDEVSWRAMQKLLSKPFLGSDDFIKQIKEKIKAAAEESDKEGHEVRPANRIFIAAGSAVVIVLSTVVFQLYNKNQGLRNQFDRTVTEFSQRLEAMQAASQSAVDDSVGLDGTVWDVTLNLVDAQGEQKLYQDQLHFQNGYLTSARLSQSGFPAFHYSIKTKPDGTIGWETVPVQHGQVTVSWYGVWSGQDIRGIFSERPVQGKSRDFSFLSLRRVKGTEGAENVTE